ncbi:MAG: hypothetical protein KKA10_09280 [Euryarchaeota archaeon]|nr:hypothetical protein [Euryarchaeota archaeon]MCG2734869.1 hypothetical protein [Candidatus Methanoperedenaceae archaeon]
MRRFTLSKTTNQTKIKPQMKARKPTNFPTLAFNPMYYMNNTVTVSIELSDVMVQDIELE